jgi:hypothetical protein
MFSSCINRFMTVFMYTKTQYLSGFTLLKGLSNQFLAFVNTIMVMNLHRQHEKKYFIIYKVMQLFIRLVQKMDLTFWINHSSSLHFFVVVFLLAYNLKLQSVWFFTTVLTVASAMVFVCAKIVSTTWRILISHTDHLGSCCLAQKKKKYI